MSTADEYLESALELIQDTGDVALDYFRSSMSVDNKSGDEAFDPVTEADRCIEAQLRSELSARYPDHGIIGEEEADVSGTSEFDWIIDPIDGTRAFMSGMPAWGTLLGLMKSGRAILGLMNQPYLDETFFGNRDEAWILHAAKLTKLSTRNTQSLDAAILYATHPDMFAADADRSAFDAVASQVQLMRYGGDCYSYCLVALGQVDLVIEAGLNPYDIVPLIPIVEGAGGLVTDWQGGDAHGGGRIIAAANEAVHAAAIALLNS
jgi:myo-inositol-1(or 4)-monophosphatase